MQDSSLKTLYRKGADMIWKFTFENFKSFEKAELDIYQLTTLIGTNALGKSNAVEGI